VKKMSNKLRIAEILNRLRAEYPDADCELTYKNPLQLLIAVILSAQCTDARVNTVTPALFARYKSAKDFAEANLQELEGFVKSTGFYKNKAKNIQQCCRQLVLQHGGEVPETMEELVQLAGVGRKTANAVRMHAFGEPGLTVDTHFQRLCKRMGLIRETHPVKIEKEIEKLLPEKDWTDFSSCLIFHGRRCCKARKPECCRCVVKEFCPSNQC